MVTIIYWVIYVYIMLDLQNNPNMFYILQTYSRVSIVKVRTIV